MTRPARLRRDVCTRWGRYSAGLVVDVIADDETGSVICLDCGFHPAGKCHTAHVQQTDLIDPERGRRAA